MSYPSVRSEASQEASQEFLGHPKGLYICFFTEMWERFSFYGMKALLFLYITKYHLFTDDAGYDLLGAYGGLVYATPILGGMLADRYLGMRKSVVLGGLLLVLGHLGMAFEGQQARLVEGAVVRDSAALQVFYLSLALIIIGVGFLKPNISTIVGKLYPENDPRRDSGFTLFYAGINLGALFSSLICAYLGEAYGWKYGFGAAGIGMVAGLGVFLWGQRYLQGHAEPPDALRLRQKLFGPVDRERAIYLGAIAGVAVVWQLMQRTWTVHGAMHLVALGFLLWFAWFLTVRCDARQRGQMLALVALILSCLVFFALYEQTYASWVAFTDRLMTKDLFGPVAADGSMNLPWGVYALGSSPLLMIFSLKASDRGARGAALTAVWLIAAAISVAVVHDVVLVQQTAGSLTFLGAFFIVLLSPLFAWLWPWLDRRGLNPSKPLKCAIGLACGGLAFLPLVAAAGTVGASGLASVWWLVLAYLILEVGEVMLSPIGLSAVTQLSVKSVVSLMMGAWFLATAYSEVLAALLSKLASIEIPEGASIDKLEAAAKYADLFQLSVWIGLAAAAVMLAVSPLIRRGMHGTK